MSQDDFAVEPIEGLPANLPDGEVILWQGRPHYWFLCVNSLNLYWIFGYFVILAAWRYIHVLSDSSSGIAFANSLPFVISGVLSCLILLIISYVQARTTLYTITNRRIVMRIGAALTINLNIPFKEIKNASIAVQRNGTGTIALEVLGTTKLSYYILWPHARPWKFKDTQPALRCVPNPKAVSEILSKAARKQIAPTEDDIHDSFKNTLPAE